MSSGQQRPDGLRRSLSRRDAVAIGMGSMVGAGLFAVWGPATSAAGRWVLVALAIAAVVALCNALSSAALAARYPSAGGTYVYARERLGPLWGYLAGWCFVVGKSASCAAMALTVGAYLVPDQARVVAVVAVVAVTGLNLLGVTRSARVSEVVVAVVLTLVIALAATLVLRLAGALGPLAEPEAGTDAGGGVLGALQAAGLLFFAFAGYARIATLGEEVRDPERSIPAAVAIALVAVTATYLVVAVLVLRVLGVSGTATTTAALADVADRLWGSGAAPVVAVVAAGAAVGALLNLLLGVSRTGLAMARDGHFPRVLGTIGVTRGVPWVAELAVAVVILAVVLVVDLRGAIGFSSFGVLLYYAVANASAWTLRGDWRPAGVVPVLGLVGCLVLAATLPAASVLAGLLVLAAGLLWYIVRPRLARP